MKLHGIALAAVGILAAASPAFAGPSTSLAPGGRTLAGPGTNTILIGATQTVYTHPGINTDVCTTVANSARSSTLRITLVDESSNETQLEVAAGTTVALCEDEVIRMDLSCLGTVNCSAQWRVDTK